MACEGSRGLIVVRALRKLQRLAKPTPIPIPATAIATPGSWGNAPKGNKRASTHIIKAQISHTIAGGILSSKFFIFLFSKGKGSDILVISKLSLSLYPKTLLSKLWKLHISIS